MDEPKVLSLFKHHNRTRIVRLIELAPAKKQAFYQLLPLLFHTNNAELPGFVDSAPHGISDYQPAAQALDAAKFIQRTFRHKQQAFLEYPIQGLYLINDTGSIYYPTEVSFDLLLVHSEKLPPQQIALLQQKLAAITDWAKSFEVELRVRLENQASLTNAPLPSEYLERLYCNGLILAGNTPVWWLVPPELDNLENYAQAAKQVVADHMDSINFIDFGPLGNPTADSVFNQGYRNSIRTMNNGLSAFIGLLYKRSVLDEYPACHHLSSDYKHRVYKFEKDTFRCESLILKHDYLSQKLPASLLGLARSSLYLLCGEKLTFDINNPPYPWRREAVAALPKGWQWSSYNIKALDHRYKATFRDRFKEFNQTGLLVKKFNELLINFAKQKQLDKHAEQQALSSLYRELFDTSATMIMALPDKLKPEDGEEFLFIERASKQDKWHIYEQDKISSPDISPLHSHASLIRLLAWAICNHLVTKTSRVRITDLAREVTAEQCLSLIDYLLKSPISQIQSNNEQESEHLLSWRLFANVETLPKEAFKRQDIKLSLQQQDAFNYGFQRSNIVQSLECLALSSSGQCHYLEYNTADAIAEMLCSLLRWAPSKMSNSDIDSWCATPNLSARISQRLNLVCQQVLAHFRQYPNAGNYIIELSERLYKIQWNEDGVDYIRISKQRHISSLVAQEVPHFSATVVDPLADTDGLYALLLTHQSETAINLFIQKKSQLITVYILDETARIYQYSFANLKEKTVVNHLKEFFTNFLINSPEIQLHLFQLNNQFGEWSTTVYSIFEVDVSANYLPISIELDNATNPVACVIHCGTHIIKGSVSNENLFKKVRELVIGIRQSTSEYPLYITKLSFLEQTDNHLRQYIKYKQKFELLLNSD